MKPLCLMVVEDNAEMRRVIRRMLAGIATEIVECADGSQALAAYALSRPDWVLMDIEMSGVDGIAATREITTAFPEAHVVIVTGHGDEPLRAAAREAGACGYVLKENLLEVRHLVGASPETLPTSPLDGQSRGRRRETRR
jgi:CheY-like chemotaxis protein